MNKLFFKDNEFHNELAESLPGVFYMLDSSGHFLMWNSKLEEVLKCTSNEIQQSHALDFFEGNDKTLIEAAIRKVFESGEVNVDAQIRSKDGVKTPYHFTGRRISRNGELVLVGLGQNISEQQVLLHEMRTLIKRNQTLMQNTMEGIHIMDIEGNVIETNDAFCNMLGYERQEILRMNVSDWNAQWTREELRKLFKENIGNSIQFETKIRCKDGNILNVEIISCGVEIEGKFFVYASSRDITERKQTEKKAYILMLRQQALMKSSLEGIHIMDVLGNIVEANDTFSKMLGYTKKETAKLNVSDWDTHWSKEELMERFQLLIHEDGSLFESKHRRKDGSEFDVEISTSGIQFDGKFYLYATSRDITERKRIAEEQRIAAVTFETQEAILITDADANILRVNKAFQEITGYSPREMIGHNPRVLQSGRHDADFYKNLWSELITTGKWSGEIWDKRKNGEIYPKAMTITAVYNHLKEVTHFVAVFRDISNRKKSEQEIHQLAFYDPLTSLPNRRLLIDRLERALGSSVRNQHHGALIYLDLDHFKTVNDTQGHLMGDQLLIEIAKRLRTCLREGDSLARLGGDEFVVVLEDLSLNADEAATQAELVAEKIRNELGRVYFLKNFEFESSVSIGVCLFFEHLDNAEDLLKHADVAMYQAKAAGRNTIRFFDPQMQTTLDERAALESDLRRALEKHQFCLYYQVQVDNQLRVFGAEVLLRWQHPERGLVSPLQFITLAEETGMIVPIGLWVLQTACAQLKEWQSDIRLSNLKLAVNVSARQIRQADFVSQVQRILLETGANPSRLKLELTESTVLDNVEDTISKMLEINHLGVTFSMDDFGTGYSSLQYLKRLPLKQIKIDQSFIHDIPFDTNDAAIVQTIIAMSEAMGLNVIAEGVETEAQREFLDLRGCNAYQGYLFGKPMPLDEFVKMLIDQPIVTFRPS